MAKKKLTKAKTSKVKDLKPVKNPKAGVPRRRLV